MSAARTAALAIPAAWRAVLEVRGKDRLTWLNGLVTCELAKAKPGDAVYGLAVGKNGKVLADLVVVIDQERALVVVPASELSALRASLDHYLIMEDAEIGEAAAPFAVVEVHGPRAGEVLAAARAAGAIGGAIDRTGLGGAIVLVPSENEASVRAALARELAAVGGRLGDERAWDALRIERAVPRFGAEFDTTTYPQEAGLEKSAVSFSKGCYLGQEVVCMLEMRGHVKRRIATIVLDEGASAPERGAKIAVSGAEVGEVTSAVTSPTLGRAIALAMIKRAHTEPGAALDIAGRRAVIADKPID